MSTINTNNPMTLTITGNINITALMQQSAIQIKQSAIPQFDEGSIPIEGTVTVEWSLIYFDCISFIYSARPTTSTKQYEVLCSCDKNGLLSSYVGKSVSCNVLGYTFDFGQIEMYTNEENGEIYYSCNNNNPPLIDLDNTIISKLRTASNNNSSIEIEYIFK